ncbi:MAG: glutamate racemase [Ardenticatenia bacterium]|nr:glutamate racemase [Ardenticatenia bacterium]
MTLSPGHTHGPIGLFDSGVGGGTVLRHIRRLLPSEDVIYLADQAHCPYGNRPPHDVRRLSKANTRWLISQGAKAIVVACNTASAVALRALRAQFPHVPFVGMVPPVKPAAQCTRTGVVGVLATPTTLNGDLLQEVIRQWAQGVTVVSREDHGLVELVEAGHLETPETESLLAHSLAPMLAEGADAIVLGCTHYAYLRPAIRRLVGPDVTILDAGEAVAQQVARVLRARQLCHPDRVRTGRVRYATTANPAQLARQVTHLGLPPGPVVAVEL